MQEDLDSQDFLSNGAVNALIWEMFNVVVSEGISSNNYDFILLLLSAYKDGIINREILWFEPNLNEALISQLYRSYEGNYEIYRPYQGITKFYESVIRHLSERGLRRIIDILSQVNKETLIKDFANIFDDVLYKIYRSQGRYGGEFLQPLQITRLISSIVSLPKGAKVFNPFAGIASFGVYLEDGVNYFGQEINMKTWALGSLRIMAYRKLDDAEYVCQDSIQWWPQPEVTFDLILANPPYGLRLRDYGRNYSSEFEPQIRTVEQFLIRKGVSSLNTKGKLIALLPQSFFFIGQNQWLRRFLVEEDLIDTIISLPGGLLQNTSVPLAILVIDKDKAYPGKVRFINSEKFIESNKSRAKVLDDYALKSVVIGQIHDSSVVRIADKYQIKQLGYDLNVPRYFQRNFEGEKLSKVLEPVRGQRVKSTLLGKLIRIRDLKNDKLDYKLDAINIEEAEHHGSNLNLITESCLLLAVRWKSLKPTYFDFTGMPIFIQPGIIAFKVDQSIVDITYLINELNSDYVQEQLEPFRIGAIIPYISKSNLLDVVIKLPSLEEQRGKVKGIFELSKQIQSLQEERNNLAHGVSDQVYENFATIKHSLGKPLLSIGSSLRNVEKALTRLNSEWEYAKLNESYDITLRDTFKSIHRNLELIHSILKNNESNLNVSKYKLDEIDFIEFFKKSVNGFKAAAKSNITISLDIHPDIEQQYGKEKEIVVKASKELLNIALNTIVENANMHAFIDSNRSYKLQFRISLYSSQSTIDIYENKDNNTYTFIKVEVANNGKPFPKNFTLEKFIRKNSFAGETGNSGQGGYDLNEIIKHHNNGKSTLDLIIDDFTTEFITTYVFLIPINV